MPARKPSQPQPARPPFWLVAYPPWPVVLLVVAASAFVFRPVWILLMLWPVLPWVAYRRGASRTYLRALRRLTIPAAILLVAGALGTLLPDTFGTVLILASLLAATWQARMAHYRGSHALGIPLLVLAAALIWRIWVA